MRFRVSLHLSVVLSLLGSAALSGQVIQGQLLDESTGSPIDRAFVVLQDVVGTEIERAFTDREGRFRIRAPSAGTYQLRSERIGFKATVSEQFEIAEGVTRDMNMAVAPVAVRLDMIEIEGDAKKCRIEEEHGLETATVWEEARKALANVAFSEAKQVFTYEIRKYDMYYERDGRPNYDNSKVVRQTRVTPFYTLSPAQRQEQGWVKEEGTEDATFDAPDAEVFFSDVFLQGHCFKLKRDKKQPGLVGLQFEPTSRKVPDVNGTMWIDEASAELRWLEIGYENLRSHTRERYAEAKLEFGQLPDGQWFVTRWYIKMPLVEIRTPRVSGAVYREEVLHGYYEEGREVLKVMTVQGQMLWQAESDSTSVP
ncbi:MAG: carboxypeptidase regulatory-like domain-containing protein [Gemmatimonadota bacterium]|nr:MAG: carboxypeptidase regulatory-like domain-containing protein [Gemmatimonadota bacterium]